MLRLSKNSGLHPKCLAIKNVKKFGEHPITAGGFGDVWKGVIGDSNEIVCLKIMKVYLNSDLVQLSKEYLREAILWRQMKHANLLPCLGIYELEHSHQLCLISPWMENGNLVQYLKNTPEENVDHYTLARDVAAGLSYLHLMKLVHGDLKGLNILITKYLRACIADFGLSRVADTHALRMPATTITRPVGTARWLAPELLMGGCGTTKASDVYAYACVCYEVRLRTTIETPNNLTQPRQIFTGLHPFPELPNEMAVAFNVAQGKRPSRPENTPRLTNPMWALMESCWDALPTSRPTADQVCNIVLNMDMGKSFLPAPNWEESVYAQVRANVEDKAFTIDSPSGTRSDEPNYVPSLHSMPGQLQEYRPVSPQALQYSTTDEDYRRQVFREIGLSLDGYYAEPSAFASSDSAAEWIR
ncbi:Rho guanine nucleotide exchange factor [Marasmius tenuissimus]|uniref:Rho guanine nucleotide exchange factor n=1 Tax=Marasmius tenuissimus TaxID=585030 RepID=A0ABR3A7N3_9AGAR